MKQKLMNVMINLILFVLGILVGYLYIPQNTVVSQGDSIPAVSQPEKESELSFFLISEEGRINIFIITDEGEKKLYSEISYVDLPSVDEKFRKELEKGIEIKGKEALAEYIQDIDS